MINSLLLLCLVLSSQGAAARAVASQTYSFKIPHQRADLAIKELARQAEASVVFPSSLIQDITTNVVSGTMTLQQALDELLRNTTLRGHISMYGLITIETEKKVLVPKVTRTAIEQPEDKLEGQLSTAAFESMLVTGSNIRGNQLVGGNVLTVTSEHIQSTGYSSAVDYLRQLPLNLAAGVGMMEATLSSQDFGPDQANLSAGQGINLRGLGALSTLVLVNGRRMANSGQYGDYVDISHIPLVAIDRVEILLDGASAIYGSDAVGGVVNILLKDFMTTPKTSISLGTATEGGAQEIQLSHGFTQSWPSGSVTLSAEFYSRSRVSMTDRERYKSGSDFSRFGGVNWQAHSLNFSPIASIFKDGLSGSNAEVRAIVAGGNNTHLTQNDLLIIDEYISDYNVYNGKDMLPELERYGLYASIEQDLGTHLLFKGHLMANQRNSVYRLGYSSINSYEVHPASPYYIDDISPSLVNDHGGIAFGKVLTDKLETSDASVAHISGALGLYYDIADDWRLENVISFANDRQKRKYTGLRDGNYSGLLACSLRYTSIADCDDSILPFNPFSTEPIPDVLLDQLYGTERLTFDSSVAQLSIKLDGTLGKLSDGDVKIALGGDVRQESIDSELYSEMLSVLPISAPDSKSVRNAFSFFAESVVPIASVDVLLAGRYEKFTGSGNYSTFDPKVGIDWQLTENIVMRGSLGTSFHAPAMRLEDDTPQLTPGGNAAYLLNVGRFGPCDSDLVTFNGLIGIPGTTDSQCSMTVLVVSGGASEGKLKPEDALTWTIGFDYTAEFLPGFSASLNYFYIKVNNRIQRIQSGTFNQVLTEFFETEGASTYASALVVNPTINEVEAIMNSDKYLGTFGQLGIADDASDVAMIVDATQRNIGALTEQGVDFSFTYQGDFKGLSWLGFLKGTYLFEYAKQATPGTPFISQLNQYLASGAPVALKTEQGIDFTWQHWRVWLTSHFVDDYQCSVCYVSTSNDTLNLTATPIKIDSWFTLDLGIEWDTSISNQDLHLGLVVQNLLNREAPFVDAGTGINDPIPEAYDFANHSGLGRTVSLSVSLNW